MGRIHARALSHRAEPYPGQFGRMSAKVKRELEIWDEIIMERS